jgi:cytochrome c-type biogenesis protein CcmH
VRLLAAALVALLLAPAGAAAATCPQTSLGDIEDEVMCLQCGLPLNVSENAPSAVRQRAFIQQQVDRCRSKDEIKAQLVAQFGDSVLAEPQDDSAWLVPAIGIAAGVIAVGFAALRWRGRRGDDAGTPAAAPVAASDAARLERDLERYDA